MTFNEASHSALLQPHAGVPLKLLPTSGVPLSFRIWWVWSREWVPDRTWSPDHVRPNDRRSPWCTREDTYRIDVFCWSLPNYRWHFHQYYQHDRWSFLAGARFQCIWHLLLDCTILFQAGGCDFAVQPGTSGQIHSRFHKPSQPALLHLRVESNNWDVIRSVSLSYLMTSILILSG